MTSKYIIRCTCGGVKTKMESAMQLIAPGEPLPKEYKGHDAANALAEKYPNTNLAAFVTDIAKKRGRYCYYIEANEKGDVVDARDLLTGRRAI